MYHQFLVVALAAFLPLAASNPIHLEGRAGAAGVLGIDVSSPKTASFFECAAKHYKVVALEGYSQYCGQGGGITEGFVENYKFAEEAKVGRIDAYLFPCSAPTPHSRACKTPKQQLDEFLTV